MPAIVRVCLLLVAAHGLVACGSAPPPRPAASAVAPSTPAPLPPRCDPRGAQGVVGRFVDAAVIEQARAAAEADMARAVRPDQPLARDYRAGRLNLHLDAQGRVTRVSCG